MDRTTNKGEIFFSATHKVIATFRGRLRSLALAPNIVVAFLFAQALNLPRDFMNVSRDQLLRGRPIFKLQPPSKGMSIPLESMP